MLKKIILSLLTVLMFFTLITSNSKINIVNADDETSCALYLYTKVDRDIKYVYEDGSTAKPTVHQEADFDGTLTFDNVTGKTVDYGEFTPESKTLPEVTSPTITGYTPDKAVVNSMTVRGYGQKHFEEIVTYSPVVQKMFVYYKVGNETLKTIEEVGRSDENFAYDPTNDLEEYARLGYEVVSDDYPRDGKYDTDPDVDQEYIIVLRPKVTHAEDRKDIIRTIEYRLNSPTGTELADPVIQETRFIRNCTTTGLDKVCDPWVPESFEFEAVNSPVLDDLTPSREVVDAITITGDSDNIYEVVIYVEDPEQFANIKIIDISSNTTLDSIDLAGKSGEEIGYDINPKLNELISHGYEVVENPYSSDILYDDDTDTDQLFVITVQPGFMRCKVDALCGPCRNDACDPTPDEGQDEKFLKVVLYRTIDYIFAEDNSVAAPQKVQEVPFSRELVVNRVTGESWYENFAPEQGTFELVNSPEKVAYTADPLKIDAENVSRSVAEGYMPSEDPQLFSEYEVVYTRIPQQGVIHFVDTDGKEIHPDYTEKFRGGSLTDFPESVTTDKDNIITSLIEVGYELISDEYADEPNKKFDNDSEVDQEYTVTLKEIIKIIPYDDPKVPGEPACEEPCKVKYPDGLTYNDLNKEFVRTIHHVDKNDVKLLDDATQDAAERYTYQFNLVTKELKLIDTKVENYPEYKAPDIEKMSKDREVVPADDRLENLEETIVYTKITYKVTFVDGLTGEELKIEVVDPGDDATAPEIPVHENYISKGWDKDFTNIQSDLVVTVNYDPIEKPVCVVKFMDGLTGKLIDVQQIECGTGAKDPGKPEHENYTPGDWDKPFDKVEVPELVVTVNYERNKCRVMFIDGLVEKEDVCKIWGDKYTGGGLIADVEYYCGDPVTPPTPKKHDGYEFDGWVKADCKMIIYAQYRKITVKPMVPTGANNILENLFNIFK